MIKIYNLSNLCCVNDSNFNFKKQQNNYNSLMKYTLFSIMPIYVIPHCRLQIYFNIPKTILYLIHCTVK